VFIVCVCHCCPADVAGVTASPTSSELFCSEGGPDGVLTFVLESEPLFAVTIGLVVGSTTTEGNVGVSSITFATSNWGVTQTVAVICEDDDVVDGDTQFEIIVMPARSTHVVFYNGMQDFEFVVTAIDGETVPVLHISACACSVQAICVVCARAWPWGRSCFTVSMCLY
jgi:hypothetical protein